MAQGIFLIQPDGNLVELGEQPYDSESILQELVAKHPNVLAANHPSLDQPRRWLLVKREMGVPDAETAGER